MMRRETNVNFDSSANLIILSKTISILNEYNNKNEKEKVHIITAEAMNTSKSFSSHDDTFFQKSRSGCKIFLTRKYVENI